VGGKNQYVSTLFAHKAQVYYVRNSSWLSYVMLFNMNVCQSVAACQIYVMCSWCLSILMNLIHLIILDYDMVYHQNANQYID
jgi:hypothetical protein